MRWWNMHSAVIITFLKVNPYSLMTVLLHLSHIYTNYEAQRRGSHASFRFLLTKNSWWCLASVSSMGMLSCGYQTASCLSRVYTGTSASGLHTNDCRSFLGFANALVQRTVSKYLVYINQIPRKDFVPPIGFDFLPYALLNAGICFTKSKEQLCDAIAICLSLQPKHSLAEHAVQPVFS